MDKLCGYFMSRHLRSDQPTTKISQLLNKLNTELEIAYRTFHDVNNCTKECVKLIRDEENLQKELAQQDSEQTDSINSGQSTAVTIIPTQREFSVPKSSQIVEQMRTLEQTDLTLPIIANK